MDVNVLIDSPLKALLYLGSLKSGYLAVKLFAGELIASGNRSMSMRRTPLLKVKVNEIC
jgi:hypothetical protein